MHKMYLMHENNYVQSTGCQLPMTTYSRQ